MAVGPAFLKAYKSLVEKPGNTEHSAKFDRCVAHVKSKGDTKNAYAVCTEALGGEAFKSMNSQDPNFIKEVDVFLHKLGIGGAGPVPNSLLAEQDLDGHTEKSFSKSAPKKEDVEKATGKFECKRCGYISNIKLGNCPQCSSSDGWIKKGAVETTGKQLERVAEASKSDPEDSESLVARMKNIQVRRQKATIAERSKNMSGQKFKDVWGNIGKAQK